MRTALRIKIPQPCQEDWNKMTPETTGRHCKMCHKTVHDFTNKTDEQIIKTFQSKNNLCGRFNATQLNRELVLSRKDKRNYLSLLASTLFTCLSIGTQDIEAQGKLKTVKVDSSTINNLKGHIGMSVLTERVLYGTVVSFEDNLPLPGASIIIKGTKKETYSDFDGHFNIKVNVGEILVISYVGTASQEIVIKNQPHINISLKEDSSICDIVIVAGRPSTNYYDPCKIAERKKRRQDIRKGKIERTSVGKFLYSITNIFRKTD